MPVPSDTRIGHLAVERGWLSADQVDAARREGERESPPRPLHLVLVAQGLLTPDQAADLAGAAVGPATGARDASVEETRGSPDATLVKSGTRRVSGAADVTILRSAPDLVGAGDARPPDHSGAGEPVSRRRIGKFELVHEIGRGGMGVVYKAWHPGLKTHFALKVLLGGESADPEALLRFRKEAQAAARLRHPGIVGGYDIGEDDGKVWIAMDLVTGTTLDKVLDDPARHGLAPVPLPPRNVPPPATPDGSSPARAHALAVADAVRAARDIAEAVQAAHDAGVIHRDLKPSNVIRDETGRLRVMDFGLAKVVDAGDSNITRSGTLMGTPAYMSPEQAEGRAREVDGRSDVYQVGAILYEALTGRRPFEGQSSMAVLVKVIQDDPVRPSRVNPRVDAGAETICLKAMARERERRYATARELAEDCRRWLEGEAILARPETLLEKAARWARRRRRLVALAGAAALALVVAIAAVAQKRSLEAEVLQGLRDIAASNLKAILMVRRAGGRMGELEANFLRPLEEAVQRANDQAPDLAEPDYHLGRVYRALGRREDARARQEAALARDPDYPPSRYEHAVLAADFFDDRLRRVTTEWTLARMRPQLGPDALASGPLTPGAPPALATLAAADPACRALEAAVVGDLARLEAVADGAGPLLTTAMLDCVRGLRLAFSRAETESRQAAALLQAALTADPTLEEARLALARLHLEAGAVESAVRVFGEGIEADKGFVRFHLGRGYARELLARAQARRGEDPETAWREAETDFSRAIDLQPGEASAWIGRGWVQARWGDHRGARGEPAENCYALALEALGKAVALAPDSIEAPLSIAWVHGNLGIAKMRQGLDPLPSLESAIEALAAADRAVPDLPATAMKRAGVHSLRAWWFQARGQDVEPEYVEAAAEFDRALAAGANLAEAWHGRAVLTLNWAIVRSDRGGDPEGLFEKSRADHDRALELDGQEGEYWLTRGMLFTNWAHERTRRGKDPRAQFESALGDLAMALKCNPASAHPWIQRGRLRASIALALLSAGEDPEPTFAQAEEDFARGLERNPRLADAWGWRGRAQGLRAVAAFRRGRPFEETFGRGEEAFAQAIAIDANSPEHRKGRGELRLQWGTCLAMSGRDPTEKFRGAADDYGRVLELNPRSADAWMKRGSLHMNLAVWRERQGGDPREGYEAALADYAKATELDPASAAARRMRGTLLGNLAFRTVAEGGDASERFAAAEAEYGKALGIDAATPEGWLGRVDVRLRWADHVEGRGRAEEAAKLRRSACDDLDALLARTPDLAEALAERARARHALADWAGGAADLEAALAKNPALAGRLPVTGEEIASARQLAEKAGIGPEWVRLLGVGARSNAFPDAVAVEYALGGALERFTEGVAALAPDARARVEADPALREELASAHAVRAAVKATWSAGKPTMAAAARPIDPAEAARRRDEAFQHLEAAATLGYADARDLEQTPDYAPLRADPRWAAVLERVRRNAK